MTKQNDLTISNAWICRISGQKIIPEFGDILISNGHISDIRTKDVKDLVFQPAQKDDSTINANGRVITVPMINFHDHFYSRLAKGLPIKGSMSNFNNILKNLWWKLDRA